MTEHVHEWGTRQKRHNIYGDVIEIWCPICGETMLWKDAKARLNATERLSAEDAREYSPCIRRDCIAPPCECADALLAYADTLEGKDETE